MNSIEDILGHERHALFLCGIGFRPENADKHRRRIAELVAEREQQFKDYCKALKSVAARLPKGEAPLHWIAPMSPRNWIDSRRRMREEQDMPGHYE